MRASKQVGLALVRTRYFLLSVASPARAARKAFQLFSTPNRKPVAEAPIVGEAAKLHLLSNNWQLSGYHWGNGSGTKRALILHGFESAAAKFEGYVSPLLQKGYEVFAFDAQAHGNSGGRTITLPEYIINIDDVHKQYGPFDAYIGHSLGASAIVHFLESQPDSGSKKAVLIAPSTEVSSLIARFAGILRLNNRVKNNLDDLIQQKTGKPVSYFSVIRALPGISSDILWIHDRDDMVTPFGDAEKVKDYDLPHVHFVPTDGLGHNRIYRDEAVKSRVLDFL